MTRPTRTGSNATDLGLHEPASQTAPHAAPQAAPRTAVPPRPTAPTAPTAPAPGAPAGEAPTQALAPPAPTRKINLTSAQVGAAAAASVTSAVGASFLGAGGTIAGAAVGSVISTVAGALYTRSLETAQKRLRETTTVLVKRVPIDGTQRPGAVPAHLAEVGEPAVRPADADLLATVEAPAPDATPNGLGGAGEGGGVRGPAPARRGRRPLLVFAGIAAAGFALAVFGLSAAESLLGHPVSGGSGGTSVGRVIGTESAAAEDEEPSEPERSVAPTEEPSASGTTGDEQPAEEPSAAAEQPSTEPTSEPEPTAEPTSEPTEAPQQEQAPAATP